MGSTHPGNCRFVAQGLVLVWGRALCIYFVELPFAATLHTCVAVGGRKTRKRTLDHQAKDRHSCAATASSIGHAHVIMAHDHNEKARRHELGAGPQRPIDGCTTHHMRARTAAHKQVARTHRLLRANKCA